jgi:hypothetical protein
MKAEIRVGSTTGVLDHAFPDASMARMPMAMQSLTIGTWISYQRASFLLDSLGKQHVFS